MIPRSAMNFSTFSDISFAEWMLFSIAFGVHIVLLGLVFFLWKKNTSYEKKLNLFLRGKNGANLEKVLENHSETLKSIDKEIQELFEISNRIYGLANQGIHKTELVRFNPFKEVGSNQSFSLALLDGKNSGTVLSSLHTREGARIYAKPVIEGKEDGFPFTEEEREAIVLASAKKEEMTAEKK